MISEFHYFFVEEPLLITIAIRCLKLGGAGGTKAGWKQDREGTSMEIDLNQEFETLLTIEELEAYNKKLLNNSF